MTEEPSVTREFRRRVMARREVPRRELVDAWVEKIVQEAQLVAQRVPRGRLEEMWQIVVATHGVNGTTEPKHPVERCRKCKVLAKQWGETERPRPGAKGSNP